MQSTKVADIGHRTTARIVLTHSVARWKLTPLSRTSLPVLSTITLTKSKTITSPGYASTLACYYCLTYLIRSSLLDRLPYYLLDKYNWCFFSRRLRRFGYINGTINVRDLLHNSGMSLQLFTKMCLPGHMYYLLLSRRNCTNLRSRRHRFHLPDYCSAWHKIFFVIRMLFEFV